MPKLKRAKKLESSLLFSGIGALYTLAPAATKSGRRVCFDDLGKVENAAVLVRAGRVLWAGPRKQLPKVLLRGRVKETDLGGANVLPAFVECHTHLLFSGNRAGEFERRNQGESYQSIAKSGGGILATVLATRAASVSQLTLSGQERVERFVRQGVTTIEVKSGYGLSVDAELKMLKSAGQLKRARIVRTFLGAHAIPREFMSAEAYVDELIAKALPIIQKKHLATRADIFIEDGYFSKQLGEKYLRAARAYGLDLVIHADQLTRTGATDLAVDLRARSADHCLNLNNFDIAKVAKSDVTCVLLPTSDLYLKCPYPEARKLIDQGARVALATDFNPGTSPSQDLALTGVLARLQMKMSLPEVISAYTVGAAAALGLERDLGSIEAGKFADFAVLSGSIEELFVTIGHQPVTQVYRAGEPLL